ncbi:MAG: PilN domain-containing protein [Candidatus Levybacteria bacterium]|nr:PilN domain-containing protein [Candidatus Levybacteria bacterium]
MANKPALISSVSINLVRGKNQSFIDKFIKWALSIGRVVVILTEAIALATFLYRFSLDIQISDLHDTINQKQAMLKYLKTSEDKYRNLQSRLVISQKLSNDGSRTTKIFKDVVRLAPEDLLVENLVLSGDYVKIEVKARSIISLASFVKALREYPDIDSVSLDKIENRTSTSIIAVGITAMLKK